MEITISFFISTNVIWDHLHIRGDHKCHVVNHIGDVGSSPHTWRSHLLKASTYNSPGIISTYVEITTGVHTVISINRDHLHIRGDHLNNHLSDLNKWGSSPHTWRSPLSEQDIKSAIGIISTYVEITTSIDDDSALLTGSSPHTWRSLINLCAEIVGDRIISTYVEITVWNFTGIITT